MAYLGSRPYCWFYFCSTLQKCSLVIFSFSFLFFTLVHLQLGLMELSGCFVFFFFCSFSVPVLFSSSPSQSCKRGCRAGDMPARTDLISPFCAQQCNSEATGENASEQVSFCSMCFSRVVDSSICLPFRFCRPLCRLPHLLEGCHKLILQKVNENRPVSQRRSAFISRSGVDVHIHGKNVLDCHLFKNGTKIPCTCSLAAFSFCGINCFFCVIRLQVRRTQCACILVFP